MTRTERLRCWDGAAPAVALALGLLVAPSLHGGPLRLEVAAIGTVVIACCVGVRLRTAALVAVLGWLLVTGFDVHRWGQLTPLGGADAVRLLALAAPALAVAVATHPFRHWARSGHQRAAECPVRDRSAVGGSGSEVVTGSGRRAPAEDRLGHPSR
jgi:hypothetical protein